MGGIGMPHLAVEYAYRYAGEYELVCWMLAAEIASRLGGDPHLAAAAAVIGGVLGAWLAPLAFRLARDPSAAGLGLGVSSHGIGTARAAAWDPAAGAAAAAAMAINALATALLAPLIVPLLVR